MRINIIFLLLAFVSNTWAQKNQNDLALKWKNGEYTWCANKGSNKTPNFDCGNTKVNITVNTDENGNVEEVKLNDIVYVPDTRGRLTHVRFFEHSDPEKGRKMYFTDKSIVVFKLMRDESFHQVVSSIGKPASKKIVAQIEKDIEAGTKIQAKEKKSKGLIVGKPTIKGQKIKSIKVKAVLVDDNAERGARFTVGIETTLENGNVLKTANIGGYHDISEYSYGPRNYEHTGEKDTKSGIAMYKLGRCKGGAYDMTVSISRESNFEHIGDFKTSLPCQDGSSTGNADSKLLDLWGQFDYIDFYAGDRLVMLTCREGLDDWNGESYFLRDLGQLKKNASGLVSVIKNRKRGLYNTDGEEILPIEYEAIDLKWVDGNGWAKKNGKWGLVNDYGLETTEFIYDKYGTINSGLCWVQKGSRMGYVNMAGEEVIPATHTFCNDKVTDGLIGATRDDGTAGFYNTKGEVVIAFKYDGAYSYDNGFASVNQGGKWGVIGSDGNVEINFEYDLVGECIDCLCYLAENGSDSRGFVSVNSSGKLNKINWKTVSNTSTTDITHPIVTGNKSTKNNPTTCTIINDLDNDQQSKYGDIRLVFDNFSQNAVSLAKGKEMSIDCDDVMVWMGESGSSNSTKVKKLFSTEGKCGQTIKLSKYWK